MPATPILMRPTSVTHLILSNTTGSVGTAGADFYIKVVTAEISHRTKMQDISGDGDSSPNSAINYWGYVDWMIQGYGIAAQAVAYAKMLNVDNNPTANFIPASTTGVTFAVHGGSASSTNQEYSGRFLIGQFKLSYDRTGVYVGVSMHLRKTSLADGLDSYVEQASS